MKKTKIAFIGANGQVGTELCFNFRGDKDVEFIPITRNVLGSAFLDYHGFSCKVSDVCKEDDARALLKDVDVVVISAYSHAPGKRGLRINRLMIENCVNFSKPSCIIIYFSTIRAYAGKVDTKTPRIGIPIAYDRHKRILENICLRSCNKAKKKGIAVRLGHVFGEIQPRTIALKEYISSNSTIKIQVPPNKLSNVVHTLAIKDCIKVCANSNISSGVYSLINTPQWSWQKLFDYYKCENSHFVFEDKKQSRQSFYKQITDSFWRYVEARRPTLRELRQFLPAALDEKLKIKSDIQQIRSEILKLESPEVATLHMSEFAYKHMPGKTIPGLNKTQTLLQEAGKLSNVSAANDPG